MVECQNVEIERLAVEHGHGALRRFGDGHDGRAARHDAVRQVERPLRVTFDGAVIDAELPVAVHGAAVFRKLETAEMEGDGTVFMAFPLQLLDSAALEVDDVACFRVEADEYFVVVRQRRFAFDRDVRRCAVELYDVDDGGSAIFADALIDGIAGGPWRVRRARACIDGLPVAVVIDLEPIIWSSCRDAFRLVHRDDLERSVVVE